MADALPMLEEIRRDIEGLGSLPLLPADDLAEYASLCRRALDETAELATRAERTGTADPVDAAAAYQLGLALRRAGDGLTSVEVLGRAGRLAEAARDARVAASAYNSAGIGLYQLGEYPRAHEALGRGLAALGDDAFGRVRAIGIRLNVANVLHYEERFEEAERAYAALERDVAAVPADVYRAHSAFERGEVLGMLAVNVAGNRCSWAQADRERGLDVSAHARAASAHLAGASALPLNAESRVAASYFRALVMILEGDPAGAERLLHRTAEACAADRSLLSHLPTVYRYAAEARAAMGQPDLALLECQRALECSLAVANDMQERRVVDTFVDVLRISSRLLVDPGADAARRARHFAGAGGRLLDRLVDFLERKDWYTGHNHSKAVATLSVRLARAMREGEGEAAERARRELDDDTLAFAATLHDIGKLTLPWSLLNKLLPLTPAERELIATHAARGERMLARLGLPEVGAIAGEHHESPDGTGYPRGARTLSLAGAVVAVADSFEAMTTVNRRYREPKPRDEAVREIRDRAGTQFDAAVARALPRALGPRATGELSR